MEVVRASAGQGRWGMLGSPSSLLLLLRVGSAPLQSFAKCCGGVWGATWEPCMQSPHSRSTGAALYTRVVLKWQCQRAAAAHHARGRSQVARPEGGCRTSCKGHTQVARPEGCCSCFVLLSDPSECEGGRGGNRGRGRGEVCLHACMCAQPLDHAPIRERCCLAPSPAHHCWY